MRESMSGRSKGPHKASGDAGDDDQNDGHAQDQHAIVQCIAPRSTKSSGDAGDDHAHPAPHGASSGSGVGAMPLLGLEPSITEKAGQNPAIVGDIARLASGAPLLGTSTSQVLEISRGSSKKRSPESICYPKLLRENGPPSGGKSRKTVRVGGRVCYLVVAGFAGAPLVCFAASATARCRPFLPKTHSGSCAGAYSPQTSQMKSSFAIFASNSFNAMPIRADAQ